MRLEELKFNDLITTRIHELPACSIMPQTSMLLCAPDLLTTEIYLLLAKYSHNFMFSVLYATHHIKNNNVPTVKFHMH
jgi:hypothetical protein